MAWYAALSKRREEELEMAAEGLVSDIALAARPSGEIVPLHEILCTEELWQRPRRDPDHETENRALSRLISGLAASPATILQTLADVLLEVFRADSAGLSILTEDEDRFYWPAIAGKWRPHIGGGTPRNYGPCGDVLDRNAPLLFRGWERRYPYLLQVAPRAEEALLVPFSLHGKPVGTIWAMAHDDRRKFDAEDLRQLENLGRFASAAYQAIELQEAETSRRVALERMEEAVRARLEIEGLNTQLRQIIEELNHRVKNTLATVQSMAVATARNAGSTDEFCTRFQARLLSLSRAHSLLTDRKWAGAELRRIVELELAAFGGDNPSRVEISGPDLELPPRMALALSMIFHELATNAAKYGSLSRGGGRVLIGWDTSLDSRPRCLNLQWLESGGPAVATPGRRGFGTRFVDRTIAHDLGAEGGLSFEPTGLRLRASIPLPN